MNIDHQNQPKPDDAMHTAQTTTQRDQALIASLPAVISTRLQIQWINTGAAPVKIAIRDSARRAPASGSFRAERQALPADIFLLR